MGALEPLTGAAELGLAAAGVELTTGTVVVVTQSETMRVVEDLTV
jgi:5,10-methylene-tetrahydrofolate dehydrogenase/methenyl tetrahydrofolate cyclohydrolase